MKFRRHAISLAALASMLPRLANAECPNHIYRISGTAIEEAGRTLSAPIVFSWFEDRDERPQVERTQAKAGRYSVDVPYYPQRKSKPNGSQVRGPAYSCDARLMFVTTMPSVKGEVPRASLFITP